MRDRHRKAGFGRLGNSSGNSLLEYAVPTGIFLAIFVPAFIMLDVPRMLVEQFANTENATVSGSSLKIKALASPTGNPYATGSYGVNNSLGNGVEGPYIYETTLQCFGNVCVNLPVHDETAGGLGGDNTHKMANVLEELAAQLALDEDVPPDLVQMVSDLANMGHGMADEQDAILSICGSGAASGSKRSKCNRDKGGEMESKMKDLKERSLADFEALAGKLDLFLSLYPDALKDYPSAKDIIDFESNEIKKIIDSLNIDKKKEGGFLGFGKKTQFYLDNPSDLTDQKSDNICDQGGQACHTNTSGSAQTNQNNSSNNSNNNSNNNSGGSGGG